jgi:hypothetical protein
VKLYTDKNEEPFLSNRKLMEETYRSDFLPTYLFLTPEGKEIARLPRLISVIPSPSDFVEAFRKTLDATTGAAPNRPETAKD